MLKSGEPCTTSGVYKGTCAVARHSNEAVIVEGEAFPTCGECGESVAWEPPEGLSSLPPEALGRGG